MLMISTARLLDDGRYRVVVEEPELGYTREFMWSARDPELYDNDAAYEAMIGQEVSALVLADVGAQTPAAPDEGVAVALEGTTIEA